MEDASTRAANLWGALDTVLKSQNGARTDGHGIFASRPPSRGPGVGDRWEQGYVSVNGAERSPSGDRHEDTAEGVIVFTVVWPGRLPVGGLLADARRRSREPQHCLWARPADGFTGYGFRGGRVERWGDYSDANVAADGSLWMATEWIQGNVHAPRLANWNTRILKINP